MRGFIAETGRAVAFLSRLPVPDSFFPEDPIPVSQSARAYALAGVVIALPAAVLLLVLLEAGLDPLFAAGLYQACSLLVTGGLHEDGLADCADGFGGASNRERALEIMKDSTIGAYGGLSLAMSVLLRTAGVAAIASSVPPWAAATAVVGVAALSRAAMVWHWRVLPSARVDGVAVAAGQPDGTTAIVAVASGAVLASILVAPAGGAGGAAFSLFFTAAACVAFTRLANARIGGHTGDTIGACQQICEIAALLGLALWL